MLRSDLVGKPAFKAAASGPNGSCLAWAELGDGKIGVFDTKQPNGPVLEVTSSEWAFFTQGAASKQWMPVQA